MRRIRSTFPLGSQVQILSLSYTHVLGGRAAGTQKGTWFFADDCSQQVLTQQSFPIIKHRRLSEWSRSLFQAQVRVSVRWFKSSTDENAKVAWPSLAKAVVLRTIDA